MAVSTKRIALDRTYLPIDPNTLPQTLHDVAGEDKPENHIPVIPFEGWNFMPTGYGWRSYFGLGSTLNISALPNPEKCRDVFTFQKSDLTHILIALCDDGIYTKAGESTGAWTKEISLVDPGSPNLKEWSKVTLENTLYVYRQGEANAYKLAAPGFTFAIHTPNTLNMAGQLGIFKAGNRLGFWDSADAVGVSSLTNFADFAPSISTLANIFTIKDKIGKIINILQHGDGWIVYATKSIIGVRRDPSNSFLWKASTISNVAGIAYRNQAVSSSPDTEHFAWTSIGLMRIRNFEAEIITPELYDYLKETQDPIYLKIIEGRYLAIQLADANYVNGILSFYENTVEGITITLAEANTVWGAIPDYTIISSLDNTDAQTIYTLFNTQPAQTAVESEEGGCGGIGYCTGKDYGVYTDHFICPITPVTALAEILKSGAFASFDSAPFTLNGKTINLGSAAQPIGELETSTGGVPTINKDYAGTIKITSPNERNFYDKVTAIWNRYNAHLEDYVIQLKSNLQQVDPKLLITQALSPGATVTIDKGSPSIPVGLGNFSGSIRAATTVYSALPASVSGVDSYAGKLPYRYELEYGKTGYTYYSIAKPTREMIYEAALTRKDGGLLGNFQFNVISRTGSGTAMPLGVAAVDFEFGDGHTMFIGALGAAGLTVTGIASITGTPITAHYVEGGVNKFQDGFAGLTVRNHFGQAWAPSAEGVIVTYNVEDGVSTPGTVSWNCQAQKVFGSDDLNITFADQAIAAGYCSRDQYISYTHPDSFIRYSLEGAVLPSPNTPPAYSEAAVLSASLCGESLESRPKPTLYGMSVSDPLNWLPPIEVIINEIPFIISQTEEVTFTFPDATFLLQAGAAAPYDVTWKGAYVYDTHLKRWGKMKADYRQLLDFSPLNSVAVGVIPYTNFGIQGALLDNSGAIKVFDARPSDSYLKFGKYGNFRQGFTSLERVRADFRQPSSGQIEVEPSFDGKKVDATYIKTYDFNDKVQALFGLGDDDALSAKWFNIAFKGQFDLSYLELTSWSASRR